MIHSYYHLMRKGLYVYEYALQNYIKHNYSSQNYINGIKLHHVYDVSCRIQ